MGLTVWYCQQDGNNKDSLKTRVATQGLCGFSRRKAALFTWATQVKYVCL